MSVQAVSKKKKSRMSEGKFEVRADPDWIARLDAAAERFGLSRSAFVRLATTKAIEQSEKEVNSAESAPEES